MVRLAVRLSIGSVAVLLGSMAYAQPQDVVRDIDPFTHVALIPGGSDIDSIRLVKVKPVRIHTRIRAINAPFCEREAAFMDPGGSRYCPSNRFEEKVAAFEVTYAYTGPRMASDEYGNQTFSFHVYYRPEELSPPGRDAVSRTPQRGDLKAALVVTTSRPTQQRAGIDEANSKFCEGNYVDGMWMQSNPLCRDEIKLKAVTTVADDVTVRVGLASGGGAAR